MKLLIIVVLAAIIFNLMSAMRHMTGEKPDSKKMARALTIRITLSVILFVFLFVAWWAGLIEPHGLQG